MGPFRRVWEPWGRRMVFPRPHNPTRTYSHREPYASGRGNGHRAGQAGETPWDRPTTSTSVSCSTRAAQKSWDQARVWLQESQQTGNPALKVWEPGRQRTGPAHGHKQWMAVRTDVQAEASSGEASSLGGVQLPTPSMSRLYIRTPKPRSSLRRWSKKKLGWGEWEEEKNLKWAKTLLQKDWVPKTRVTSWHSSHSGVLEWVFRENLLVLTPQQGYSVPPAVPRSEVCPCWLLDGQDWQASFLIPTSTHQPGVQTPSSALLGLRQSSGEGSALKADCRGKDPSL